jgi:hypothetical protein
MGIFLLKKNVNLGISSFISITLFLAFFFQDSTLILDIGNDERSRLRRRDSLQSSGHEVPVSQHVSACMT